MLLTIGERRTTRHWSKAYYNLVCLAPCLPVLISAVYGHENSLFSHKKQVNRSETAAVLLPGTYNVVGV